MNQEQIDAELAKKRKNGALLQRLNSVRQRTAALVGRGVPSELRAAIEEANSSSPFMRSLVVDQRQDAIAQQLKDFDDQEWKQLGATLLPGSAPYVDSAIRAMKIRPYQVGLARRPFRCPESPATLAVVRSRWLVDVALLLGDYDADIRWITERASHLARWSGGTNIGWLLAGAINAGGSTADDVMDSLAATIRGEGDAQMGAYVTQALLSCNRPAAWEQVEKLLLAAQRQEGLRQTVLESVDESHPLAFRRMLRLIQDERLTRFSAVVRAADVWFGFMWDAASASKIDSVLQRVLLFLDDESARNAALDESDAETVYLALWSAAFEDVETAITPAITRLRSPSAEVRFVAAHFLADALWSTAVPPLLGVLADSDLRVAARALDMFALDRTEAVDGALLFGELERLLARMQRRTQNLDAIVWPWTGRKLERAYVANALAANSSAVPGERLLPYVPDLSAHARAWFIQQAAGLVHESIAKKSGRSLSAAERTVVIELLGDASESVRSAAFEALQKLPLLNDEVDRLIDLLARKPGDLRNGAIKRLSTLDDTKLLAAAERLLGDGQEPRRLAGLELLRSAWEQDRQHTAIRERVQQYTREHPAVSDPEQVHISALLADQPQVATGEDGLGLIDRASLRSWPAARKCSVKTDTTAARESLESLAELVLEHQTTEHRTSNGEVVLLVESATWAFGVRKREDLEAAATALPLADVWQSWLRSRAPALRDADDLELLRALCASADNAVWQSSAVRQVSGLGQYAAGRRFLLGLCEWCLAWEPPKGAFEFLLDGFENELAHISNSDMEKSRREPFSRAVHYFDGKMPAHVERLKAAADWLHRLRWWRGLFPASVSADQASRLYGLLCSFAVTAGGSVQIHPGLDDFLGAYRAGALRDSDFLELLVGRAGPTNYASTLRQVSARKTAPALLEHPELQSLIDRCRRRIVEVETGRGDRETAASGLALELRWTGGLDTIARAVPALGKTHFARTFGWSSSGASRQETLSHLVLRSVPRAEDSHEAFASWAKNARISQARLIELAVYAPQWARHVNHVLQWPGLESSVWWIHAHTKDDRSWRLAELKEDWAAEVSERTPLSATDLTEGGMDVDWFRSARSELGAERWEALDKAAKYAASSAGHTRAQLFSRTAAGLVTVPELLERIEQSRHKDSVRALGLVPLADGEGSQEDLRARYLRLQQFAREARKFGSQRQQSESRAVALGLANLARTAGYRDPQRLQWAMERLSVGDLANGPLTLVRADVTLALAIDAEGVPSLTASKQGKTLKAVPATLKKDSAVEELKSKLQELKQQRSRVRNALEDAMCRADRFRSAELRELMAHPIVAPALGRLVFIGEGSAGYLIEGGRCLRDHAGLLHVLGHGEEVHIAHAHDLFERGDWSAWQRECFRAERVQPFKQLFRELYPRTSSETGTAASRRYAGHQVNPRQALALLGGRGWVARPEEGVSRTFHAEGLTARLGFQEPFFTPADIEGLTLEEIIFTRKGEWHILPLEDIPAPVFSEVMRDLDLAVSVAHQGGVDPEASAATVEMRAALLRETCELLELRNVEIQRNHAIIQGSLGRYSVHLASAGVMVLPGTAIPLVAVHSQHRGRLFLPFADDDPRTAEVMSKVLLLARDQDIRDSNILERIRNAQRGS